VFGVVAVAAPRSADEFLALVRKSELLDPQRLSAYMATLCTADTVSAQEPDDLARRFVSDGILTFFQAEQLLLGKWRGFTIDEFKILERLGCGRTACVYLAEHKKLRRRVAVKVLPTVSANDPALLERFFREARAVACLHHPNIVQAYQVGQHKGVSYLVIEYVDGPSLQDLTKGSGPKAVNRAAHYYTPGGPGVAAHSRGHQSRSPRR
jgi:serine/threonine protein kinase